MSISFLLLRTVNARVNDLRMKLDYSEPKIFTGGIDISNWSKLSKSQKKEALSKNWFVYFSFRDPKTGKLKKQPFIKAGANKLKNKRERYAFLKELRNALSLLLSRGFSPYQDNTELENIFLDKAETKPQTKDQSKYNNSKSDSNDIITNQKVYVSESIKDAFKFGLSLKEQMMNKNSFVQYKSRIGLFEKWLIKNHDIKKSISSITKKLVNEYLNEVVTKTSARNRNNSRTDIASLFQLFEDNELIPANFVKSISKLKSIPKRNKTYQPEQEKLIYDYLEKKDPMLLLMIKFISYNFLRPIEVCRLRIEDVDVKDKKLYVIAKNQPVKIKIIPDILLKELPNLSNKPTKAFLFGRFGIAEIWNATETNRRTEYSKRFKLVKDKFDLGEDFGLYSFRHTFITKLYRKLRENYTPFETKSKLILITGHTTMHALEKYLRDIDAELPDDYSDLFE